MFYASLRFPQYRDKAILRVSGTLCCETSTFSHVKELVANPWELDDLCGLHG